MGLVNTVITGEAGHTDLPRDGAGRTRIVGDITIAETGLVQQTADNLSASSVTSGRRVDAVADPVISTRPTDSLSLSAPACRTGGV